MAVIGYYNGRFVDPAEGVVPIEERGHEFGDGVYEVIRVYAGRPFLLEWHIERLLNSLSAVRIASPHDALGYRELIQTAIAKSGEREASVYLQVTRGAALRNHLFPEGEIAPAVSLVVRPVTTHPSARVGTLLAQADERWANVYIKTINLLPNILAKQAAHDAGADEALLVRDGYMLEASSSNLWFVRDGALITAPADRYILPGITRRFVLDLAADLQIPVYEQKLPYTQLARVEGMFLTGTTTEIFPIGEVVTHPHCPIEATLPSVAPHPLVVEPEGCTTIWQAANLELVHQMRSAFDARIQQFRNANAASTT